MTTDDVPPAGTGQRTSSAALWGLIVLFTVSGFSGLIYESIWTQYLKLWLGHAAYAQSLVLTIFMGGMALGAWLIGRRTDRIPNLLIGYAIVEGIIGLAGIVFHDTFNSAVGFAHDVVLPSLGTSEWVEILKWTFAAALILPQSVLLGMTFPLMSGALLRRYPNAPGHGIAALYFSNSFGAAIGVLASGFVFIPMSGLPGTVLTAGAINLVLAAFVYLWAKSPGWTGLAPLPRSPQPQGQGTGGVGLLLTVSLLTGMASFIYEISWIRMLSMVLGSSTHAFELMLSAFILGLALGSLWVRGRIERISNPLRFLGWVQLAMGCLAVGTILVYDETFVWMSEFMRGLGRNSSGYALYNIVSHATAMAVMLPVTIAAGMTLPLITFSLLKSGFGERSIGHVYAANTVGAILGVLFAIHIGLPALGLADTLVFGAGIDIVLGLVLLYRAMGTTLPLQATAALGVLVLAGGLVLELDPKRMASSVFRYGSLSTLESADIAYNGDGKTATIHVAGFDDGMFSIMTNGKTDSSLQVYPEKFKTRSLDEYNMSLLSALPLAAHRDAKRAAVIGFGAGLSSHVMLADPNLEVVDSIEIEPRMVEAAQIFRPRVHRAFDDPRSVFQYEDARTFFATRQAPYDVIASEPSTPWVSGVASLYTEEFYTQVKANLSERGIFAQWLHGSELSLQLTALVGRTLGRVFDDYIVFNLNGHDAVFIATRKGAVDLDPNWPFKIAALKQDLATVHLTSPTDIRIRYLGNKALLDPWFQSLGQTTNSDYFPLLDLNAVEARFRRAFAREFFEMRRMSVPVVEMLAPAWVNERGAPPNTAQEFNFADRLRTAERFAQSLADGTEPSLEGALANWLSRIDADRLAIKSCGTGFGKKPWWETVTFLAANVLPQLSLETSQVLLRAIRNGCADFDAEQTAWLELMRAVGERNGQAMTSAGEAYMAAASALHPLRRNYALSAAMLGYLANGDAAQAMQVWERNDGAAIQSRELDMLVPYARSLQRR